MLASAVISAYWAARNTGLLDIIAGSIARRGHDGAANARLALAAIVVPKLVGAWLPLRAMRQPHRPAARRLAWLEAAILAVHGGVLTATGLVVQAGLVHAGANTDSTSRGVGPVCDRGLG